MAVIKPVYQDLDYDYGTGEGRQALNRIPFAFAVMRARREHFRKEAVQPTMCFVHHRATMQFQCRSGRNCRNYSRRVSTSYFMLRKRHQFQVSIWKKTEQSRFFWGISRNVSFTGSRIKINFYDFVISVSFFLFRKERSLDHGSSQFSTMERYELLSRTNQTKLKVYNRVSNSDRYEVK